MQVRSTLDENEERTFYAKVDLMLKGTGILKTTPCIHATSAARLLVLSQHD